MDPTTIKFLEQMRTFSPCATGLTIITFLGLVALYGNLCLALVAACVVLFVVSSIEIELQKAAKKVEGFFAGDAGQSFCCIDKTGKKCYSTTCEDCDCVDENAVTKREPSSLANKYMKWGNRDPHGFFGGN